MHRRTIALRSIGIGLLFQLALPNGHLLAQSAPDTAPAVNADSEESSPSPAPDSPASGSPDTSSIDDSAFGVPYSKLFRETSGPKPGVVNSFMLPASEMGGTVSNGENLTGHLSVSGLNAGARVPISFSSPDRSKVHIKLGPLYIHFDSLTASLLYDNLKQSPGGTRERWYSIIDSGVTVVADIGERFSLVLNGHYFYLPFQNRFGATADVGGPWAGGLLAAALFPAFHAQAAYTIPISAWPVTIADDLRFVRGRYSDSADYTFEDAQLATYNSERSTDTYTFGRPTNQGQSSSLISDGFAILSNSASISTRKSIPGDWLVSSDLRREDLWYFPQQNSLPAASEQFNASIYSQRESFRFKPYAIYNASHIEGRSGINQVIRAGVFGPITDLLYFHGEIGYFITRDTLLGTVEFTHVAGPNTSESLRFSRDVNMFYDEISNTAVYSISQVLGPQLTSRAYALAGDFSSNSGTTVEHKEGRLGLRFTETPSPKTHISLDSYYARLIESHSRRDVFESSLTIKYTITDTFDASLIYAFATGSSSDVFGPRTTENVVLLQLRKSFR